MENDIPTYQSYEIEKLVDKRVRKYNKTNFTQYLMKWLKYGPEHDQWKNSAFNDCLELVEEYETSAPILAPVNEDKSIENNGQIIIRYASEVAGLFSFFRILLRNKLFGEEGGEIDGLTPWQYSGQT